MKKFFIPSLLMAAGLSFAQDPEHLTIVQLPKDIAEANFTLDIQNIKESLLKLAKEGNKGGEYNSNYNMIAEILQSPTQPITDDELLELRKAMSVQVCNFGIFEYYFCNSKFVQGDPTAVFKKYQGSQGASGFVFRSDDKTLYVLESSVNTYNFTATTYTETSAKNITSVKVLYKVSDNLYAILRPSNGTCGEVFILK